VFLRKVLFVIFQFFSAILIYIKPTLDFFSDIDRKRSMRLNLSCERTLVFLKVHKKEPLENMSHVTRKILIDESSCSRSLSTRMPHAFPHRQ